MEKILKLVRPVDERFPISSGYEKRIHPKTKKPQFHRGYDFAVPVGTPIKAMHPGIVAYADWQKPSDHLVGFGLYLRIAGIYEFEAYLFYYGHCSELLVKVGDPVDAGELIAISGDTGLSSGPHLHAEARNGKTYVGTQIEFYD